MRSFPPMPLIPWLAASAAVLTACLIYVPGSAVPAATDSVRLERAFPRLRFERPIFVGSARDGSGQLYVGEQAGVVRAFDNDEAVASSRVVLDIRERVSRKGNEEGLIGLAFHPRFEENGELFAHYSSSVDDMRGKVVRYRRSQSDPSVFDPGSEELILEVEQPFRNHNGGSIAFGPDGYLYISFGDGGSANDPHGNGQDLGTWLGAILRVDVDEPDSGRGYSIPGDNPFAGNGEEGAAAPEIWAYGLRNVWRFSFDRANGDLWAGDVGQNKWEEVDLITSGGNYGWNRYEADADFDKRTELAGGPHVPPVASFERSLGISITGGHVYRGGRFPELDGAYVYGDYASGNLWLLRRGQDGEYSTELAARTGRSVASFGEDADGEVFVVSFDGGIYRLVPGGAEEGPFADWPEKLSGTGLYTSTVTKELAPHVVPYAINAPFWSDGAEKERYVALPEGAQLGYRDEGPWDLPVGATLIKNFQASHRDRPRLVETRLIRRVEDGFVAATYVWDSRGRDATLAVGGRQFELYNRSSGVTSWHAPSASECVQCHVAATGFVLGLTTAQLNMELEDGGPSQLEVWDAEGIVDLPEGFSADTAARFANPYGDEHPVAERARVWLDVNCAMCHQPMGPGNASIDLRHGKTLAEMGVFGVPPAQGNLGIEDALLVAPGEPDRSLLLHRVETLGDGRMPNLATNQVDAAAVELLKRWIEGMPR